MCLGLADFTQFLMFLIHSLKICIQKKKRKTPQIKKKKPSFLQISKGQLTTM